MRNLSERYLKANSETAKRFVDLYLDPSLPHSKIMEKLNVSKATFYRLIKESEIPSIPASLLSYSDLPKKSDLHWKSFKENRLPEGHSQHVRVLLRLSKEMGVRFEVKFLQTGESTRLLEKGKMGVSFSSMTYHPGRFEKISFSYSYLKNRSPLGVFIASKCLPNLKAKKKPKLGVLKYSMLDFYATKNGFNKQFKIQKYLHAEKMMVGLERKNIDLVFDNPHYQDFSAGDIQQIGDSIHFGGHTGIAFSQEYDSYKRDFNQALERLDSSGFLDTLPADNA